MTHAPTLSKNRAFSSLQDVLRMPKSTSACERCGLAIEPRHAHLVDLPAGAIVCVCDPCALLLGSGQAKYRRVPAHARALPDVVLSDAQWRSLAIPIGLAFCLRQTHPTRLTAFYPSPAGATEAPLSEEAWHDMTGANPQLEHLAPDVEALLINRLGADRGVPAEYFAAPIDRCYALVGLVRAHWRGLGGGERVWREIAQFFAGLRDECGLQPEALRA